MNLSRRQVLTAVASAGVGAAAVGVAGFAAATDTPSGDASSGPIVAHLRDPASGTIDVFVGESRIEVRDRDLAARLQRAATAKR